MATNQEQKSEPRKPLGLRIRPTVKRELKKAAAESDVSMEEKLEELVCRGLGRPDLMTPTQTAATA